MLKPGKLFAVFLRFARWRWLVAALVIGGAAWFWFGGSRKTAGNSPVFAARRGPLEISVLEGGSLQALESQQIKCEVRVGYQGTKILRIVEEGYLVTDEDVRTNKVLVELDSSDLQKQIVQQEIQYQTALASLINAQQNYEIQLNQNQSDIKAAEQKARFARMDFDKFLGDTVTEEIIRQVGLDKLLALATTNNIEQVARAQELALENAAAPPNTSGPSKGGASPEALTNSSSNAPSDQPTLASIIGEPGADLPEPEEPGVTNSFEVDFSTYAHIEKLGDGEAKQKLRKFEDDLQVAQKELGQASSTLDGTKRLFEKGFVTKTDLQRDEIAFENSRLKVQTAESARDLFLKYDFVKSAEETLSKYAEAVRELDKARRVAISKLAQAKGNLKSAQGQHQVQLRQRNDLNQQLAKCTLRAQKPGLVVYGAAGDEMFYYGGEERIREGATVRERQAIITIPDTTRMSVKVKIHESYIKKIKKGQKARITVDAFPDEVLAGEVTKVGVLPDSQNRWMNPDMKVYLTEVTIDGTHDWAKPGMSAKVEILVNHINNCVYVPIQAVSPDGDSQVCFVARHRPERRLVQIGGAKGGGRVKRAGVAEGELVLLQRPDGSEPQKPGTEHKAPEDAKPQPTLPVKTAPARPTGTTIHASK